TIHGTGDVIGVVAGVFQDGNGSGGLTDHRQGIDGSPSDGDGAGGRMVVGADQQVHASRGSSERRAAGEGDGQARDGGGAEQLLDSRRVLKRHPTIALRGGG